MSTTLELSDTQANAIAPSEEATLKPRRAERTQPRPAGPLPDPETWLSLSEAAAYLGCVPSVLRKAVSYGRLSPVSHVGHVTVVQWKSVVRYQETMGQVRSQAQLQRRERERAEARYRDAINQLGATLTSTHATEWLTEPRPGTLTMERAQHEVAVLTAILSIAMERARGVDPEQARTH